MRSSVRSKAKRGSYVIAVCALMWLSASCEPPGKPGKNSEAENRESIMDFRTLFSSNCAGCHGENGKNGPARILNDALYLSIIPKETLHQILVNGRPANGMPAWARSKGGPLTDKQIDALADGIYSTWGKRQPSNGAPAYAASAVGDAAHGKQLFGRNCFACHAQGGLVGPVTDPSYLQLVSDQMLRTSIIVGRPDLGMPDYRMLNSGHALADRDVTDLVAYLVSKRPASDASNGNAQHQNENGTGSQGEMTKGNEGSGNGPGSPRKERNEGNKGNGSSSQRGGK
jgi:cytochrome c oxidase cbb3-type subunit III